MEPYYNLTYGQGMEGFVNYSNTYAGHIFVPVFLIVVFALMIYVLNKKQTLKSGAILAYSSLVSFLLTLMMKTITAFNDFFLFAFAILIGVGIIIAYFEGR